VLWKPHSLPYIKVNTNGSLQNSSAACGGIFRDQSCAFMGGFSAFLDNILVLEAEIMGFIIAMEMAARHQWHYIWIDGDSTSALLVFFQALVGPY
jgi:ribonuclease HI